MTADEIAHRHTHRHGAVTVAELSVIVELERSAHRVILDRKGVNDRFRLLQILAQEAVEIIVIHAFARNRAVEAAETTALEGIFADIDHAALSRQNRLKASDHTCELRVVLFHIGDDHDVTLFFIRNRFGNVRGNMACCEHDGRKGFVRLVFRAPQNEVHEIPCFLSALFAEKIIHIRGKSANVEKPEVHAVVLDISVCRHVVKMLGRGELRRVFSLEGNIMLLDQFNEAVKLIRRNKGIDGIGEQDQIRSLQSLRRGRKILFERLDPLTDVQNLKALLRIKLL